MAEFFVVPVMPWETQLSSTAGVSVSLLRYTLSFFASVPVGLLLKFVPTAKGRHLYSLTTGSLLVFYPFGPGCLHMLVPSLFTYLVMLRIRQHCGTLSWLVTFPYLILCHALNASGITWKEGIVDFTGCQMVLTLKVISIAVCYQDGLKNKEALRDYPQSKALHQLPSLLEFFGYLFGFGNLLAGPFFEFRDYKNYAERAEEYSKIPSPYRAGIVRVAKAVVFLVAYQALTPRFPPQLLESPWYHERNLWTRLGLMMCCGAVFRFKFYFAWSMAESSLIFSGICYNGNSEEGKARWDRYINARTVKVETCTSAAKLAHNWNVATGNWLRHYVYERLTKQGKKPTFLTLLITQLVSGVWHGLYPGYALFFAGLAFFFQSSRVIYRYERRFSTAVQRHPLWMAVKWVYTITTLDCLASSFMILTFNETVGIWKSVHFIPLLVMLVLVLLGWALPPARPPVTPAPHQNGVSKTQIKEE